MKFALASVLMLTVASLALPAWAEDRSSTPPRVDHQSEVSVDVEKAVNFVEQLFRRGLETLQDHVEVESGVRPGQKGERWGHLSLRLYPKGKSRSDERMEAETWLGFAGRPEEDHFRFDFKLSKRLPSRFSPDEYL